MTSSHIAPDYGVICTIDFAYADQQVHLGTVVRCRINFDKDLGLYLLLYGKYLVPTGSRWGEDWSLDGLRLGNCSGVTM